MTFICIRPSMYSLRSGEWLQQPGIIFKKTGSIGYQVKPPRPIRSLEQFKNFIKDCGLTPVIPRVSMADKSNPVTCSANLSSPGRLISAWDTYSTPGLVATIRESYDIGCGNILFKWLLAASHPEQAETLLELFQNITLQISHELEALPFLQITGYTKPAGERQHPLHFFSCLSFFSHQPDLIYNSVKKVLQLWNLINGPATPIEKMQEAADKIIFLNNANPFLDEIRWPSYDGLLINHILTREYFPETLPAYIPM